jgi:hypothetical protein
MKARSSKAPHYIVEDQDESRREGRKARGSGESEEGLTKGHEVTLFAKVDSDRIV